MPFNQEDYYHESSWTMFMEDKEEQGRIEFNQMMKNRSLSLIHKECSQCGYKNLTPVNFNQSECSHCKTILNI